MALAAASEEAFHRPADFNIVDRICQRANHSNLTDRGLQWKSLTLVLQQNHGTGGESAFECEAFGTSESGLHFGFVDIRAVKQPQLILRSQDGQDRLV